MSIANFALRVFVIGLAAIGALVVGLYLLIRWIF